MKLAVQMPATQWIGYPIMLSLAERLEGVHPRAKTRVSPNAKYVSGGLEEFVINKTTTGLYRIARWKGGRMSNKLDQLFTTHEDAEKRLVQHLRSTDKFGRAIYPNAES